MFTVRIPLLFAVMACASWTGLAQGQEPPLIPRDILFGNPEKVAPRISPDGKLLSYLAPDKGVLNVWVRTAGKEDDRVVTRDRKRGIRIHFWAADSRHILYLQDREGDENWHLYSVNLDTGAIRDLSPFEGIRVQQVFTDDNHPKEIIFGMNLRDPKVFDLYRCDLTTGAIVPEAQNAGNYVGWLPDNDFRIRAAVGSMPDGGFQLLVRKDPKSKFEPFLTWGPDDSQDYYGFTPDNKGLYLSDSVGANTTQLYEINLSTKSKKVIAHDPQFDVGPVMMHPKTHVLQAVGWTREKLEWKVLDSSIAEDFKTLVAMHPGQLSVGSRDLADQTWLVWYGGDKNPARYYVYDRKTRKASFLFSAIPALDKYVLAERKPVKITSRDGLALHSYLTVPPGKDARNLPLILNVHGGPWGRDSWGYHPEAQWLANRGYACLQVNFRGSAGFGKNFLNAGNREWAGKMHDDLIDAVNWAVREGIADPKRICIFGGSYGGYATLVGVTFTPDVFACGVDIVGPSNIVTLLNSIPPYWTPLLNMFRHRVGHEEKDKDFLESRSPLFKADKIKVPLLIAQGANDPRVRQAESDQIVTAMRKNNKPVEYLVFPDEGHGFARPENRLKFYAAAEQFLAKYLGRRAEPPAEKDRWEELRK